MMPVPLHTFFATLFQVPKHTLFRSKVQDLDEFFQPVENEEDQPHMNQSAQEQQENWMKEHKSSQLHLCITFTEEWRKRHCMWWLVMPSMQEIAARDFSQRSTGSVIVGAIRPLHPLVASWLAAPWNAQQMEKHPYRVLSPWMITLWQTWSLQTMQTNHHSPKQWVRTMPQ